MTADKEHPYNNTFLLDLAQSLGRIEGQNMLILKEQGRAAEDRRSHTEALDVIRADVALGKSRIAAIHDRVGAMEPDVTKMKAFRAQLALAVFVVTGVVTGAINLVWIAVTHLGEIKVALREFLR
jgi:hypothetical protein